MISGFVCFESMKIRNWYSGGERERKRAKI